jgi:hypothetical protein
LSSEKIKKRSFISKLKKEDRINENFLNIVSDLTLEELIGIKIEMASRMFRGKLYGIPLWISMPRIVKESMLRVAINLCKTKTDTASFLGVTIEHLNDILRNYNIEIE